MKNKSFYLETIQTFISIIFIFWGISLISFASYTFFLSNYDSDILQNNIKEINSKKHLSEVKFLNDSLKGTITPIELEQNWWLYPSGTTTSKPFSDPLLILISKKYYLPNEYLPYDLIEVTPEYFPNLAYYDQIFVSKSIQKELNKMCNDALGNGYQLAITSGYRSYTLQDEIFNYWENIIGYDEAIKLAAKPGHSQHQQGTAIDLTVIQYGTYLSWQDFENHPASDWLVENSWKYGFVLSYPPGNEHISRFASEKWHYRYIGVDNAKEFHESGRSFQEWLEIKNGMLK